MRWRLAEGSTQRWGWPAPYAVRRASLLQRVPGASWPSTPDLRHRFLSAAPQPGQVRALPTPAAHSHPVLDDGYRAWWGTLGAQSAFSAAGALPPHYLLSTAAAAGLDFVAIADDGGVYPPASENPAVVYLPAWRWTQQEEEAIVYAPNNPAVDLADVHALNEFVTRAQVPTQWLKDATPLANLVAMQPPPEIPPSSLVKWFEQWRTLGLPALPAGNSTPPEPGAPARSAVTGPGGCRSGQGQPARRPASAGGWIASEPGVWLTLRAEIEDGPLPMDG